MAASVGTALSAPWTEQLFEDDFVIVAHQGHPILAAETLAPRDMTGFEWALVSSSGDPVGQVDDALRPLGLMRRVLLTVPNFLHAPQIVAETGLVIALGRRFSKMAAAHWPLGLRELPLPVAGFTANMMWLAQRDGDPVLGWIRSLLRSSV
ncbi:MULTISPECIES: LysR substrate-binding domain-containing protein [unclassified Mesorhizobium]|uniref:LysR substrate-binding domain-containing protein n=1 Tax=unclassified Mesorhizobium TaxID=325217 RepID=UPI000BAEF9B9|nr:MULTISPECIES: LysR substrate-binding domain-containing protein [unclassified Mesorhizobium]PBC20805.1 hypothetical protein CK226_21915 [Mesorhizobium sp. WSM4311]TRD03354.1 hypothetical protein FJV82_15550 [Mesorhizobium sp. WSM4305]